MYAYLCIFIMHTGILSRLHHRLHLEPTFDLAAHNSHTYMYKYVHTYIHDIHVCMYSSYLRHR